MSLSLSHRYPESGVVLDCIDFLSLHPYLLCPSFNLVPILVVYDKKQLRYLIIDFVGIPPFVNHNF